MCISHQVHVFFAHVLIDKKTPNRQSYYFRDIDEMDAKFAPDEKRLNEIYHAD